MAKAHRRIIASPIWIGRTVVSMRRQICSFVYQAACVRIQCGLVLGTLCAWEDNSVSLEGGKENVEYPESYQDKSGDIFKRFVSSELSTDSTVTKDREEPSKKDEDNCSEGADDVNCDRKCQSTGFHLENSFR